MKMGPRDGSHGDSRASLPTFRARRWCGRVVAELGALALCAILALAGAVAFWLVCQAANAVILLLIGS